MKTFENQYKLPRLPIPNLAETIQKLLKSCYPFAQHSPEWLSFCKIAKDFESGIGQSLQLRLIAYDKTQQNSWLEAWWLKLAYLTWRESVL
jgi:carnitine O-acetyltransferase